VSGVRLFAISVSIVMLLASCQQRKDRFDRVLDDMQAYRDRMCACPDVACADKVTTEMRGYQATLAERTGGGSASDEQERAGRKLQAELRDCRKLLSPPAAPAPKP
jgi:hypothetical protein